MLLYMLAVRDSAADSFNTPFFVNHKGTAVRSFGDECKKADSPIAAHPGDYELFELGTFDTDSAAVVMLERPHSLARGADYNPV